MPLLMFHTYTVLPALHYEYTYICAHILHCIIRYTLVLLALIMLMSVLWFNKRFPSIDTVNENNNRCTYTGILIHSTILCNNALSFSYAAICTKGMEFTIL